MNGTLTKLLTAAVAMTCLFLVIVPAEGAASPRIARGQVSLVRAQSPSVVTFSLDGVALELTTPFLSDGSLTISDPDSAIQIATAVRRAPLFRVFSITAVPFGTSPPTESLPVAGPGQQDVYRAALKAYREEQGGRPRDGAAIRLFGEDVIGSVSVVDLHIRGEEPVPVVITEWVVEAGPRLWIVRASKELKSTEASQPLAALLVASVSGSSLRSSDLSAPSSSLATVQPPVSHLEDVPDVTTSISHLPTPPWWDGECDTVNFSAATGSPAYPLGAEYRGMKACGPRPWADDGPERWVSFGEGAWQIEWQCPELSKRFLYLTYGIPPYSAHGSQVVQNYSGDVLEKVSNCTPGRAPQPDDVLSYGHTTTYGHTSVVIASDVDASGHGAIEVIEQNSSSSGQSTHHVSEWCVQSSYGEVSWLHHPGWSVDYYSDDALTDHCASTTRSGSYLFESWGGGAPDGACPVDHFSARFSRSIEIPGGVYTFALGYDDGARLMVDGETVVDGWGASNQHYGTRELAPGCHQLRVDYYDQLGEAALTAFWWGPGFELTRETWDDPSRWYTEYWGNQTLWWDPLVMTRGGDAPLDLKWYGGGPAESVPADHFSSRFRRAVPLQPGRWRFDIFADDGLRFWIDDLLIVDEWQDQVAVFTPTVSLSAGDYELRLEHFENLGHAKVGLDWERVSQAITPTSWIVSPLSGTVVSTTPVTIAAHVDEDVGAVDRVEFHARYDGRWHHLGDDDEAPYRWTWLSLPIRDQTVWLTTHVWDEAGRELVDLGNRVAVRLDYPGHLYLPLILARDASGP